MVRISSEEQNDSVVLRIEGSLREPWVTELERVWQTAITRACGKHVCLNLAGVSYVDDAAKALLGRMSADGVELRASGPMMTAIVQEIICNGQSEELCAGPIGSSDPRSK